MLRFPGSVDDATHDGDLHHFNSRIDRFPGGHLLTQIALDLIGHVLEVSGSGAATARAGNDLRRKGANFKGLQDLLADEHFLSAVAIGQWSERSADRIANPASL